MIEPWTLMEPRDGLPRTDRHGVTWTPRDGAWWRGDVGTGDENSRQWWQLSQRGPFEVAS